jgi:hypothetical protein
VSWSSSSKSFRFDRCFPSSSSSSSWSVI